MKLLTIYNSLDLNSLDDVFNYLISNLQPTVNTWSYFVNWQKVFKHIHEVEVNLNIMNSLIGKKDIVKEFRRLVKEYPSILKVLPILVAFTHSDFTLLVHFDEKKMTYKNFKFSDLSIEDAVEFCINSNIFTLLSDGIIKNLVDYVFGIEVGLDSNGRKNRSGTAMEDIVEYHIELLCKKYSYEYIPQATAKKVHDKWGIDLTVDKSSRQLDFAIKTNTDLYLVESNYYSGSGSKLKSTAGEFRTMFDFWTRYGYKFIWITDGDGWKSTHRPLRETFEHIDYILNIKMMYDGILEHIITNSL